jgi:hypothetical protein
MLEREEEDQICCRTDLSDDEEEFPPRTLLVGRRSDVILGESPPVGEGGEREK